MIGRTLGHYRILEDAATRSMTHLATSCLSVSVARDKLVFNIGDVTGNVWLARPGERK